MNQTGQHGVDVVDETPHGPASNRRYRYEPTFLLRGLSELHLTYNSVACGAKPGKHEPTC